MLKIRTLVLSALFSLVTACSVSQTKHALVVAIGNYPDPINNGWAVINSLNDVALIKNALVNSQQFSERNIQVLTDSMATKKGIVDALDKLIGNVKENDIVIVHFSSHGEQIEDDNNDEIDGLDEVIVPYGAVFDADPAKFSELSSAYLRDDLFGDRVTRLRNKLGKNGDLLVIIDACHSGSGTRGVETAKIRGGNIPMVSSKFGTQHLPVKDEKGVFNEGPAARLSDNAATFVVISGAQAKEVNYECYDDNNNPVGSLSYSFSKTISSLKGNITYRGLFAMIENIMREKAPKQKPVLEGDGIDRELFGGKYEKQQPYFTINRGQSKNDLVALNAGFVSGITKGSEINFFNPGTTGTAGKKRINSGKVISTSPFTSVVKLDSADDKLINLNPWAFINELSYGGEKLKFSVRDIKAVAKMVQDSLKDFQLVEFNANYDLILDTSGSTNNWALKYPNSGAVFQDGFVFSRTQNMEALKEALKRYDRFRYLKGLSINESGLSAIVELVFLDAKGKIDSVRLASRTHFGRLELLEGDDVYLRIINNGNKQFYINIVDIQPDGIINPVMPNKNLKDRNGNPYPLKWEDCLVKKYDTLFLRDYPISIQKPYGEEIFKVFLSTSALDLEDILTTKDIKAASNKRGVLSGLEKIFISSNINENGTRGGVGTKVNADQNGTVFSLNFQILPK
ncbi:MAG: caspase family protein [Chitinophagaceae bacterium]|nr:caspase family protein [Chitinophagaceae bacterium]